MLLTADFFLLSKKNRKTEQSVFYRERELLINEKLMYFKHLVGSTVEAMLEQKDSFHLVRNEEHGAIHTWDVYICSRPDNLVVRWASTSFFVIVVCVGVEDPGSRTNIGFYEGNTILFQVLLWICKLHAQTTSFVQLDGHDESNLA